MKSSAPKKKRDFLLIHLLNSFNIDELEGFKHFVECPYFNKDQFAIKLFDALQKKVIQKTEFTNKLQIEIYTKIFTGKEKPKGVLNSKQKSFLAAKMNVLLRLAETFLCNVELKKNAACKTELLFDSMLKKDQFQILKRKINKLEKYFEANRPKQINEFTHKYKFEYSKMRYLINSNQLSNKDNFASLNQSLDIFYILDKLVMHIASDSYARLYPQKNNNSEMLKSLKYLLSIDTYANHPLIKLYLLSIELQDNNYEMTYQNLISLIDANYRQISKEDLNGPYKIASNFCSLKIKQGENKYYKEMFQIYQKRDAQDLLTENDSINIITFKNLIALSCRLEEYNWADKMIEKYISYVSVEFRDSVNNFSKGLIAFYKNKFDEALKHFIRVENIHPHYDIDCRIMILKSHYMLDEEYDERTMRIFLWTEKFIKEQKKMVTNDKSAYKNFVRILINIYKLKHKAGKTSKEKLHLKINNLEVLSDKKWLTQVLNELPG